MFESFITWLNYWSMPIFMIGGMIVLVAFAFILFIHLAMEVYKSIYSEKIYIVYTDSNKDTICFYKSSNPPENILSYKTFDLSEEEMAILYAKKFALENNLKFEHKYKEN